MSKIIGKFASQTQRQHAFQMIAFMHKNAFVYAHQEPTRQEDNHAIFDVLRRQVVYKLSFSHFQAA